MPPKPPNRGLWHPWSFWSRRRDQVPAASTEQEVAALWRSVDRILSDRQHAREVLDGISPSTLPRDIANAIAKSLLESLDEVENGDKYRAYSLALVLERWLPHDSDPQLAMHVYERLAMYDLRANNVEQAIVALERVCQLALTLHAGDQFLAAATNLGTVLRQAGAVGEALQIYEGAMKAIEPTTSPALQAMVYLNASTAYEDQGHFRRAMECNERALAALDDAPEQQQSRVVALTNLAGNYLALERSGEAESTYLQALDLARQLGLSSLEGVILGHLGLIRFHNQQISDAIHYLSQAVQLAEKTQDLWNAQHWYQDLANVYSWTGAPDIAGDYYDKALAVSRTVKDLRAECRSL